MKKAVIVLLGMGLLSSAAWGDSIVLSGTEVISGTGFGALPRALTIDGPGNKGSVEQGCIAPGSPLLEGPTGGCGSHDTLSLVGGNEEKPDKSPKQSAPTLSSLGITDGSQIGILFDAVQPPGTTDSMITIDDLSLKLYDSTGTTLLYTVNLTAAPETLATNPGNGKSDYLFILDSAAIAAFDAACGGVDMCAGGDYISLDSELDVAGGGPESYTLINDAVPPPPPIPEPSSLLLLGTGALGLAGVVRRRFGR